MNVIELLIAKSIATEGSHMHLVLNLGGPDKVSRADMADVVAEVQGYNKEFVKRVSALSVSTRNLIGTTIRAVQFHALVNESSTKLVPDEMPQLAGTVGIFFPIDEPSVVMLQGFLKPEFTCICGAQCRLIVAWQAHQIFQWTLEIWLQKWASI